MRSAEERTYDEAEAVQNFLFFNYNIEVPVKASACIARDGD